MRNIVAGWVDDGGMVEKKRKLRVFGSMSMPDGFEKLRGCSRGTSVDEI